MRWTLDVGITQASKSKVKRPTAIYEFQLKNEQTQVNFKLFSNFLKHFYNTFDYDRKTNFLNVASKNAIK